MLTLKAEKEKFGINLPTNVNEFTPEFLNAVCEGINIPKYYCIIALCHNIKLMDLALNVNGNKEVSLSVIPIIAKINADDSKDRNINVSDKVIMDRSSLERGVHINIATMINSKNVATYIRNNEELRLNLSQGGDGTADSVEFIKDTSAKERENIKMAKSPTVYILEFKIVPITEISATLPAGHKIYDPFKSVELSNVN